jgi:hypothetical protein
MTSSRSVWTLGLPTVRLCIGPGSLYHVAMSRVLAASILLGMSSCSVPDASSVENGSDAGLDANALDADASADGTDAAVELDAPDDTAFEADVLEGSADSSTDAPQDAATDAPQDAATDVSQDAATDAPQDGPTDTPDSSSTVLFEDNFEDQGFDGWRITSPEGSSDAFSQVGGLLTSGPGESSATWNSPVCDAIGPAIIQSPAFPAAGGRFTIETDIFHTTINDCNVVSYVALVDSTLETRWNTSTLSVDYDYVAQFVFVPHGGVHVGEVVGRMNTSSTSPVIGSAFPAGQTSVGEWYKLHVEVCGADGFLVRLTDQSGSTVHAEGTSSNPVVVPPAASDLRFEFVTEGKNKAIDNLRISSGCEMLDALQ